MNEKETMEAALHRVIDEKEALDIKANNQAVRIEELERALADIENYYAQHYREGEVGYQAVLIARNVKR